MAHKKTPAEKITTIKLLEETKLRVEKLREHKRESYDDILRKILYVLNTARESPEKAIHPRRSPDAIRFLRSGEFRRNKQAKIRRYVNRHL